MPVHLIITLAVLILNSSLLCFSSSGHLRSSNDICNSCLYHLDGRDVSTIDVSMTISTLILTLLFNALVIKETSNSPLLCTEYLCPPQISHGEALTLNVIMLGGRASGRYLGSCDVKRVVAIMILVSL